MLKFSANLGFLWRELDLISAIRAASKVGFDAVEFHWPYEISPIDLKMVLDETNIPAVSLNTRRGNSLKNENGLAALIGRSKDAREGIDEAISYARVIHCDMIHVMAGVAPHKTENDSTFRDNLLYASEEAAKHNKKILIEVLNPVDAPGYFLNSFEKVAEIIANVHSENIKLIFDCYHFQMLKIDLKSLFLNCFDNIGHIQIASFPGRNEPNFNSQSYIEILNFFQTSGWSGFVGAEYCPRTNTDEGISWLSDFKNELCKEDTLSNNF